MNPMTRTVFVTLCLSAAATALAAPPTTAPSATGPVPYAEALDRGVGGRLGGPIDQFRLIEGTAAERKGTTKGDPDVVHELRIERVDGRPLATPVVCPFNTREKVSASPPAAGAAFRLVAVEMAYSAPNLDDPNGLLAQLKQGLSDVTVQAANDGPFFTVLYVVGPAKPAAAVPPTTAPAAGRLIPYSEARGRGIVGQLGGPINQVRLVEGTAAAADRLNKGARDSDRVLTIDRVDGKPLSKPVAFDYAFAEPGATPPAVGARFRLLAAEKALSGGNPADPNGLRPLLPDQDPAGLMRQARFEPAFHTDLVVFGPAKP